MGNILRKNILMQSGKPEFLNRTFPIVFIPMSSKIFQAIGIIKNACKGSGLMRNS